MTGTSKSQIEIIRGMSYSEFTNGIQSDKTLQFQFDNLVFNDQRKLLSGANKFIFNLFLFGYMIGPLVFVPLMAYKYDNWYLLFGILISYFSTFLTIRNIKGTWAVPLIFLIWYWIKYGFHFDDYLTFFWFCYFWGGVCYQFAVGLEEEYAKIEILKNPDMFNTLSQKGFIFFMKKNPDLKESNSSEAYIMMGRERFESEDFDGAILHFDKAIEISPNYGKAYLNRGLAKNEIDDYDGAIHDFDKAIELSPKDFVGYFSRGLSNIKSGNKIAARADLNKAGDLGFTKAYDLIKSQLD